jgi:hypothetical protein
MKTVSAITGMLLSLPCTAQVSLVRDGTARAVVLRADEPSSVARYAVERLWHVEEATGVALEVMPESETPAMALGLTQEVWSVLKYVLYPVHVRDLPYRDWAEQRNSVLESAVDSYERHKSLPIS